MSLGGIRNIDYQEIWNRLNSGDIVPFFGAGASACYGLPTGATLAASLVEAGQFPDIRGRDDLALVASYVVQMKDSIVIRRTVRQAINSAHEPGRLHELLASCEAIKLYVTTNYDDLLELALAPRRPWWVIYRGLPGTVSCRTPEGDWKTAKSEELRALILASPNPIILKLHGSLAEQPADDSFLITEEQYIDFLGRPQESQIPSMLVSYMQVRSFLFLGYALRDWNVRVLLRKLQWATSDNPIMSWGIVRDAGEAEMVLWKKRNVELHEIDLRQFVTELEQSRNTIKGAMG